MEHANDLNALLPGLPGGDSTTPTSCYDIDAANYVCRLVYGVEETGSDKNYFVMRPDALRRGRRDQYGATIMTVDGTQYEGCVRIDGGRTYYCDYMTKKHVSRRHYRDRRWVLKILWKWATYTGDQAACAGAITDAWSGNNRLWLPLLEDCRNGPM